MKEILFKETHEQVGIGRGHTGTHGCALNLKVMEEVEGEVVVGKDELSEGYEDVLVCGIDRLLVIV